MKDPNCDEFRVFSDRYGDETAGDILEDICCLVTTRQWPWRIRCLSVEHHDREGNNATITGYLRFKARSWDFVVESGNWNGTVVHAWDRCSNSPCIPPPGQSVWMFAGIEAVAVSLIVQGSRQRLSSMTTELMNRRNLNGQQGA